MPEALSFPRQQAVTRRFRLGVPRGFRLAPEDDRLAFIRSSSGRDPVGSLWVLEPRDGDGGERCVVDARTLLRADGDLPDAEKARRERMRETTSGITGFSTDDALSRAVFSLDGIPFVVDLVDPGAVALELPHPGPVVDPRLSPDGRWVAFVHDRSLYVVLADGTEPAHLLAAAEGPDESWGLADFVAAEELDRVRGLWWLGSSDAVLAELVDESPVEIRWIADPAQPEREPRPHRYPSAGTPNPIARLFRIGVDGTRLEIAWDREAFPYLATVEPDERAGAVVSVLSRDQRSQVILDVDDRGGVRELLRRTTDPWITMQPGVPARGPGGQLLEIVANTTDDCFQLLVDGVPVTPPGLQVTGVAHASTDGAIITAQQDPRDQHVYAVDWTGSLTAITSGPSVNSAAARGTALVLATADMSRPSTAFEARMAWGTATVTSHAEVPVVHPRVHHQRVTGRQLATALLWPTGHEPGSGPLPVLLTPYGGPHLAQVRWAQGPFAADQWLADQGFAVIVTDGAGTPGRGPAFEFEVSHDLASRVLDDQVAALHALADQHSDLDLGRVGITGWSFGGYLSALAVLDRPDVFHAAVAGAPVTNWALYDTAYTERYLGTPQENPEAYAATSLLERADRLTRPLLIIHGLADDNVLAAHTLQLSSALLAAGRSHSVLPLSGVTHMTPQEIVAENLLRLQVEFFTSHLV